MKTLLDVCCSAGGGTRGYQRAGFYVIGVDKKPQPRYVGDEFIQMDAIDAIRQLGQTVDAIHVSPPCQFYTRLAFKRPDLKDRYPDMIGQVRDALQQNGRPYVIENVPEAPLLSPIILCGAAFGLRVYRHRAFESNMFLMAPAHLKHRETIKQRGSGAKMNVYTSDPARMVTVAGHMFSTKIGRLAMGIDWMNRHELAEAIPPIYTEWIGRQLMAHISHGELARMPVSESRED